MVQKIFSRSKSGETARPEARHRLQRVNAPGGPHLPRQVGRNGLDICADIQARHTGSHCSVDISMEGFAVIAERNDREIEMVMGMQQREQG